MKRMKPKSESERFDINAVQGVAREKIGPFVHAIKSEDGHYILAIEPCNCDALPEDHLHFLATAKTTDGLMKQAIEFGEKCAAVIRKKMETWK